MSSTKLSVLAMSAAAIALGWVLKDSPWSIAYWFIGGFSFSYAWNRMK
jgi:hypothetical protein